MDTVCDNKETCFFCGKDDISEKLVGACTFSVDQTVREYAEIVQDQSLLAKLSEGDMHALDAKYHTSCKLSLYNKFKKVKAGEMSTSDSQEIIDVLVFSNILFFLEEQRESMSMSLIKMSELCNMYDSQCLEIDSTYNRKVNSTRLKDRILHMVPNLQAQRQGKDTVLIFETDVRNLLSFASTADGDALHLARAAKIVRKHILSKDYSFDSTLKTSADADIVPESMRALIGMILYGNVSSSNLTEKKRKQKSVLSVSETVMFNTKKTDYRSSRPSSSRSRHAVSRETPLAIYTGLLIYLRSRQKEVIEKLWEQGLCISYHRAMEIATQLGNTVCERFVKERCVCPPALKQNVFTAGAVDNLDHNTSGIRSESFHGTALSLMQFPRDENPGTCRETTWIDPNVSKTDVNSLPVEYTQLSEVSLPQDPCVPHTIGGVKALSDALLSSKEKENEWLVNAGKLTDKEKLEDKDFISWAAFHASRQPYLSGRVGTTAILPLFVDKSQSPSMMLHAMNLIQLATQHVNPGQIPVITADMPLYAICKQIQWQRNNAYGEDKLYVILLGGLHIEMNVLKLLGDWLNGSGWKTALIQSEVTSTGRAEQVLKGSFVVRSRYAHQVTAASLHILMWNAYREYKCLQGENQSDMLSFGDWHQLKFDERPQFAFWSLALFLELLYLQFVRSLREGNFKLYVQCLGEIVPWLFALDHTHYSRWMPVHIRDMVQLPLKTPHVYAEFKKGYFSFRKTSHAFSAMALDQCHEQNNAKMKADGGIIGLTDNPTALVRWITAGPEVQRILEEFEEDTPSRRSTNNKHHEQTSSFQKGFQHDVISMVSTVEELDNPLSGDEKYLMTLDTKQIMEQPVVDAIRTAQATGQQQYEAFVEERLVQCKKPITDTIKRNKMPLFNTAQPTQTKQAHQLSLLKNNCALFGRMYVSCQSRDGDLEDSFAHENQAAPPSLSDRGLLRQTKKADLLTCLDSIVPPCSEPPCVSAKVFDGPALVHMLAPKLCKTFQHYAENIFIPYKLHQLESVERVDVVWDRYLAESLKAGTRHSRGIGDLLCIKATTPIPSNWNAFLRVDANKEALFEMLADYITSIPTEKCVVSTKGTSVQTTNGMDTENLSPSNHEEADTRILLHVQDCAQKGHTGVSIRTVDTDVVVLAISVLKKMPVKELWIAFGVGNKLRYIPVHAVATQLGEIKSRCLPVFHSFTGCDTVSGFASIGKKTAWEVWKAFPPVTDAFLVLAAGPNALNEETCRTLEKFVVLLYDKSCQLTDVNAARKKLFVKGRQLDRIPPTQGALLEHTKRATLQGGHIWGQALRAVQDLPDPAHWGWCQATDSTWTPHWTDLPEAAAACKEFVKCGCKTTCRLPCKCCRASLPCTDLYSCGGSCYRSGN